MDDEGDEGVAQEEVPEFSNIVRPREDFGVISNRGSATGGTQVVESKDGKEGDVLLPPNRPAAVSASVRRTDSHNRKPRPSRKGGDVKKWGKRGIQKGREKLEGREEGKHRRVVSQARESDRRLITLIRSACKTGINPSSGG